MIIDAHAHLSQTEYGNIQIYLDQLKESNIDRGILVPGGMLDVRRMTDYVTGKAKPESLEPNNQYILDCCRKHTSKFKGFICLNPYEADALKKLEHGLKTGFRGLKLSPMSHQFSFGSKIIGDFAASCGEFGYPIYSHVVYSPGASTARFVALVKQFPKTNFILGHMGFGPADVEGLEAAATLDNFYLETSTCNFLHLQESIKKAGSGKIIFGSEFPLSHPMIELQKVLLLRLSGNETDGILCKNIRGLLKL
jgi:predicted TIM-barrel fold metal-dependent hydrolase